MSEIEKEDIPPLDKVFAKLIAENVCKIINSAVTRSPGLPASSELLKMVSRRVPPKMLHNYNNLDAYGVLIWDETMTILDRILVYPYVAKYRKNLSGAPYEINHAWQFHSHSLRGTEIYIILDRTLELLRFIQIVARDVGLSATDQRKDFEKSFKKEFDRRLRERHRLTHAHERPSLVSRIIDLSGAKIDIERDEAIVRAALGMVLSMVSDLTDKAAAVGLNLPTTREDWEVMYEAGADKEARQMLNLVAKALHSTFQDIQ